MTQEREFEVTALAQTVAFGQRLAPALRAGDTIFLIGDLGAGKTALAKAVIATLCGVDDAPSPTYTLVQTYETQDGTPFWHADLYRIESEGELDELGLDDAFDTAITFIEWPDRLGVWKPADRLEIELLPQTDGLKRLVKLRGMGSWDGRLDDL